MGKIRKIIWFSSTLNQAGGGERLLLEGIKYFGNQKIRTSVLTYDFNEKALFDGGYKANIVQLMENKDKINFTNFLSVTTYKLFIIFLCIFPLRKAINEIKPDVIICQSENNAIMLYFATLLTPFSYVIHIFGQTFQFPEDLTKYALIFRRHLGEIRESVAGYMESIPEKLPKCSLVKRILIELVAVARYIAVRKARRIFVLSNQVKWEVNKLYNREAIVSKGAFPSYIFEYVPKENIKKRLCLEDKKIILNINRLIPKKRIDLCIQAFKEISNRMKDIVLVIGGTGPDEERLKSLAKDLDIESKVRFVGYIKEKELWDYYAICDVFVQLDRADFDIVSYEALGLGKKVIWSTEIEVDGFLDGNRFIFPADPTINSVSEVMKEALETELITMTSTEKENLYHYTWDNYFGGILREIEKAVKHD